MDRTKGIGGTDIAAIVGLNPWKSAIDVYMEKLGLVEEQPDSENMWWGREMEPVLQRRYEKETGLEVQEFDSVFHVVTDFEWHVGTPDGIVFPDGGVDYKTTGYSKIDEWGEVGTDQVPEYYHCQAMWYMGLTGAQWWDVACLFMGARREFKIYRINRDQELIDTLMAKGKDFWENHIIPQIPPPVDASPGWDKFFKEKMPQEDLPIYLADGSTEHDILAYRDICSELKTIESRKQEWENKIKSYIGNHEGIRCNFGKLTWKKSKDRTVIDWEAAFNDIYEWVKSVSVGCQDKDTILKRFTTIKPGPRVFRCAWNKEK